MEMGLNIVFTLLMTGNTTGALVKLQITKENLAMLHVQLASYSRYWHVAHIW